MLDILEILELRGFDSTRRFQLVRHQEGRHEHDLPKRWWLETYQAFQARNVFDNLDCIVSFLGDRGTRARFIGVYEVLGRKSGSEGRLPHGYPSEWKDLPYYYELRRAQGFEDLENRVVINWGPGARSWVQKPKKKEVVEILPKGQRLPPFADYLGFSLTHSDLKQLYAQPEANREWRDRLRAVAGIYLILATTTGAQYVGSAYGLEGIWGRW